MGTMCLFVLHSVAKDALTNEPSDPSTGAFLRRNERPLSRAMSHPDFTQLESSSANRDNPEGSVQDETSDRRFSIAKIRQVHSLPTLTSRLKHAAPQTFSLKIFVLGPLGKLILRFLNAFKVPKGKKEFDEDLSAFIEKRYTKQLVKQYSPTDEIYNFLIEFQFSELRQVAEKDVWKAFFRSLINPVTISLLKLTLKNYLFPSETIHVGSFVEAKSEISEVMKDYLIEKLLSPIKTTIEKVIDLFIDVLGCFLSELVSYISFK